MKDRVNAMPAEEREDFIASLAAVGPSVGVGGAVRLLTPALTDIYQEQKDKIDEIEDTYKKYETSIGEDYANLDLGQALDRTFVEIIGGVPQLIQAMVPGVGLASIALGSAAEKSGDLQREGEDLGLKTSLNSIVSGAAEGIFEVVTRKLGKKLLDSFKINPEETLKSLASKLKEIFIDVNLEGGSEAATSIVQKLSDALIQGKDVDFYDALRETIDSYIIGAGTGGSLTGLGKAVSTAKNVAQKSKLTRKIKDSKYNNLEDVFIPAVDKDGNLSNKTDIDQVTLDIASSNVSRKFVVDGLNKSVKKGKLTREEADKRLLDFDNIREANTKVGDDIQGDDRLKSVDLIREKNAIQKEIKNLDPALTKNKETRIKEINNELEQIANAIQEQETRDIPDAEPAEGVQEVETEVRVTPEEETKVETEEKTKPEVEESPLRIYRMDKSSPKKWKNDFEILDNRKGAEGLDIDGKSGNWYVINKITGDMVAATSKKDAQDIVKNAPSYGDLFGDGTEVDIRDIDQKDAPFATFEKIDTEQEVEEEVSYTAPENVEQRRAEHELISAKEAEERGLERIKGQRWVVINKVTGKLVYSPTKSEAQNIIDSMDYDYGEGDVVSKKNIDKIRAPKEEKVTPEVTDGVSKLRATFNKKGLGSKKPNTPAQKVNIEDQAIKAKQSISKLFPNVEIEVYYNENDYHQAIGDVDQSGGTYFNNKVYINLTRATDTTVAHEVFHAVLSQSLKSDAEIQNLTKKFVDSLINGNDKDVIQALVDKVDTIEQYKDVANEEIMAELFGVLAGFGKKLKPKTRSLVKRFLDRVAKILGLKKFTDNELIDVLNTLSKKVALGESIEAGDIGIFKGGKVVDNPSQAISKKSVGLFDVQYTEDNRRNELIDKGLLVEVNDVSGFSGLQATITSPDDMLAGTISIDGKQIFEGGGGIFFVTKYGDVWASGKKGTANTLAKMINDSLKNNGDRGLLVLAKGADQKLISSVSGVNSSLAILDVMLDKGLISPSDFRSAVSGAVKAAGGIISLSGSAKQLKSDINKYFSDPNTTTFEKRGNVVKDLIGRLAQSKSVKDNSTEIIELLGGEPNKNLAKGSTKLSQSLGDLVARVAAEQLTKGLSVGDVYGIIEVNSEVEVIEDSHPSYPFHIRLKDGSSPKLILPKNRQNGSEVLKTSTGKVYRVGNVSVLSGSFNPNIKSKKQVSGRPSIDEVRRFAKENNISDADTRKYLKELGYTQDEIASFVEKDEEIYVKKENKVVDWLRKQKDTYYLQKVFYLKMYL